MPPDKIPAVPLLVRLSAAATAVGTVLIVVVTLAFCSHGLDFTDEGYYIGWIAHPHLYPASATQFGFVYHPLFELLGSDLARARQANVLITFALGWALSDAVLRQMSIEGRSRWIRLSISAAIATSSLTVFMTWLITPSYNSLGLQSTLVAGLGLILATGTSSRKNVLPWALIGVGLALAFLAKPTTAAAIAGVVLISLLATRRLSWRPVLLTGAFGAAAMVVAAFAIDGSIGTFITRVRHGAALLKLLGGGQTPIESLRIDTPEFGQRLPLIGLLAAAFLIAIALAVGRASRAVVTASIGVAGVAVVVSAVLSRHHLGELLGTNMYRAMLLMCVPVAAIVLGFVATRVSGVRRVSLAEWVLALTLFALPHAYACGSNGNYWRVGGSAAIFWVLAGFVLLGPLRERVNALAVLLPFAVVVQVITAGLLALGAQTPHREPVGVQDQQTAVKLGSSSLKVGRGFATYIEQASSRAKAAGFTPGTPVIDLSGKSPSLLYALGAKSIGQPWTIGGYHGSVDAAIAALGYTPCSDIGATWLLTELSGKRRLSFRAIKAFGIHIHTDYQPVARWDTARGAAGYTKRYEQILWKPVRDRAEATAACRSSSGGGR